ncbi:hypothetical protein NPIL_167021 [Nephila pilipes]|uniref:Uncharacterized protein n=1 Tax=Nephila pilipes TaxID=299642 RepID=A0A8X6QHH4_NEPPI|nr:hypothetical protein NPIL_167021 [Nephila pilipes]
MAQRFEFPELAAALQEVSTKDYSGNVTRGNTRRSRNTRSERRSKVLNLIETAQKNESIYRRLDIDFPPINVLFMKAMTFEPSVEGIESDLSKKALFDTIRDCKKKLDKLRASMTSMQCRSISDMKIMQRISRAMGDPTFPVGYRALNAIEKFKNTVSLTGEAMCQYNTARTELLDAIEEMKKKLNVIEIVTENCTYYSTAP